MYVYVGNVVASFFPLIICMYIYIVGGKRQIDYQFIPTDCFVVAHSSGICMYIYTYIHKYYERKKGRNYIS